MSNSKKTEQGWIHPWEQVGHGKAPFSVIGYGQKTYRAHPDAPIQPGGSCDVCGQGIMNVFRIRSADGKEFNVGIDCVAHTEDEALLAEAKRTKKSWASPEAIDKASRARAEAERIKQQERDDRAFKYAQKYEKVIRNATAALQASHVPQELRTTAQQVLEGLVTGLWREGPDEQQIKDLEAAAEIAAMTPWVEKNAWMGRPGDKFKNLRVLHLGGPRFASKFGWHVLNKFRVIEGPDAGKLLTWFTSNGYSSFKWKPLMISATIKKHDSYQDDVQTQLTRVKIEGVELA